MAKYPYQEFFRKFPQIYKGFSDVVQHSKNFEAELRNLQLLSGVRSLMSIGAGEGALELSVAQSEALMLGYIDPSSPAAEVYQRNAQKAGLTQRCVETHVGGFESFQGQRSYDLVLSIHSWYAFGKNEHLLRKALQLMGPGGAFFLTLISRSSLVWKLADLFENKEGSDNLCAEDISEFSKSLGLEHRFVLNRRVFPSTYFLKKGLLTQPARDVAAFLNFSSWDEISPALQRKTLEYFRDEQVEGQIAFTCGCLIFRESKTLSS